MPPLASLSRRAVARQQSAAPVRSSGDQSRAQPRHEAKVEQWFARCLDIPGAQPETLAAAAQESVASIDISEEGGVRFLHFGSHWIQGAMRIARPWALELDYTRDMILPLLLRPQRAWPRSVLQVGLGAASLTKFLYRHRPQAKLVVVEISPDVVTAAWQFFKLPDDAARLTIDIGDGHAYMAATRARFDLILVDGFDAKGRAGMLDTVAFYCNCRARLADDGIMVTNLLSRRRGAAPGLERIRKAFEERVLALPPCEAGNTIVIATAGDPIHVTFAELRTAARALKADTGLNLLPTVAGMVTMYGAGGADILL